MSDYQFHVELMYEEQERIDDSIVFNNIKTKEELLVFLIEKDAYSYLLKFAANCKNVNEFNDNLHNSERYWLLIKFDCEHLINKIDTSNLKFEEIIDLACLYPDHADKFNMSHIPEPFRELVLSYKNT